MVTTSVGSRDEALALARALVSQRLAACVQITPIESIYRWRDGVETAAEQLMVCKVAAADYAVVEAEILARHSYDLPEIVASPIVASAPAYLEWMVQSVAR